VVNKVKRTWSLQIELYKIFHQWHIMLLVIGLGCLVGWLTSYIFPSKFRSISEVYVGFNPYRTYSDTDFLALTKPKYSNLDNYLFWQMAQLEEVAYLKEIVNESLTQLQNKNPYWKNISEENFQEMLGVDWRSAGKWSFIVENSNEEHAEEAVVIWSEIVKETAKNAVVASQETFMIDQELQSIQDKLIELKLREVKLQRTQISIQNWKYSIQEFEPDQAIDKEYEWEIINIVTLAADFTPIWQNLLENQPTSDCSINNYFQWIEQVLSIIDLEINSIRNEISSLEKKDDEISKVYSEISNKSLGLSPNLTIEKTIDQKPKLIRPTSTLSIIGGSIGLLTWFLIKLVSIAGFAEKHDNKE
jgi:hypothetical protein